MRKLILCLITLAVICQGCHKSTFVPDKQNPGLPAYSEKGNDIAGAYINGETWIAEFLNHGEAPATIPLTIQHPTPDTTIFYFEGKLKSGNQSGNYVSIVFVIGGTSVKSLQDLINFNNTNIVADGVKGYAYIDSYLDIPYKRKKGTGYLNIKRVQVDQYVTYLTGNSSYHPLILSGLFNFTIPDGAQVTQGRFDAFVKE